MNIEAQQAAEERVLHRFTLWRVAANRKCGLWLTPAAMRSRFILIKDAIEAATPWVEAAERERIAQLVESLKPQSQSRTDFLDYIACLIREDRQP